MLLSQKFSYKLLCRVYRVYIRGKKCNNMVINATKLLFLSFSTAVFSEIFLLIL